MRRNYRPYAHPYVQAKKKWSPLKLWAGPLVLLGVAIGWSITWATSPHPMHGTHEWHSGVNGLAIWTSDKTDIGVCGIVYAAEPPTDTKQKQKWIAQVWDLPFGDHGMSSYFDDSASAYDHVSAWCAL